MSAVKGNLREPRPFGSSVGEELSMQRDSEPSNGRQQAAEPCRAEVLHSCSCAEAAAEAKAGKFSLAGLSVVRETKAEADWG